MADEITIVKSFKVLKNNLKHSPPQKTFKADVDADNPAGPTPGSIVVTTEGIDLEFTELIDPGYCCITNQENTGGSDIEIGMYDPETMRFYPIWIIRPGRMFGPEEFSPLYEWETYPVIGGNTGTGTGGRTNRLRLRAKSHACYALVECFER